MNEEEMITLLKETEEKEAKKAETRKEKTERRRSYCANWRQDEVVEEDVIINDEVEDLEKDIEVRREMTVEMRMKRAQYRREKEGRIEEQEDQSSIEIGKMK